MTAKIVKKEKGTKNYDAYRRSTVDGQYRQGVRGE